MRAIVNAYINEDNFYTFRISSDLVVYIRSIRERVFDSSGEGELKRTNKLPLIKIFKKISFAAIFAMFF